MKTSLIIVALALFAGLVGFAVFGSRPDERVAAGALDTSGGPWFAVEVVKPRAARPLFGLLPKPLETKMQGDSGRGFNSESLGAEIGRVGDNRLELNADGWDLLIETDDEGRVAPGTHLVFPLELAGKPRTLRCGSADGASGYLRTSTRAGSDTLDGHFSVELATCELAETGEVIEWPPAPLVVRGSFGGSIR